MTTTATTTVFVLFDSTNGICHWAGLAQDPESAAEALRDEDGGDYEVWTGSPESLATKLGARYEGHFVVYAVDDGIDLDLDAISSPADLGDTATIVAHVALVEPAPRKVSHVEDGDHEWRVFVEGDTEGAAFSDDEVIAYLATALDANGDFFEVRTVEAGEAGEAVHFVTLTEGDLYNYSSGGYLRKATRDEVWSSATGDYRREATSDEAWAIASGDKHTGTFNAEIEGVPTVVYVIPA